MRPLHHRVQSLRPRWPASFQFAARSANPADRCDDAVDFKLLLLCCETSADVVHYAPRHRYARMLKAITYHFKERV